MENQPDKLKEIRQKWYTIPTAKGDASPPIEGEDISWLIAEVERLRNARIKDHEHYIGTCKHIANNIERPTSPEMACFKIERTISQYLRGLRRVYLGESYRFSVVDTGDRRP